MAKTITIKLPKKHPIFKGNKAGDKMHVAMHGVRGDETEEHVPVDLEEESMEHMPPPKPPARKSKGPMAYLKEKRGGMVK